MTVDEIPSGIYLYPEEESVDNIFTPVSSRSSTALFEEAQKEVLKLMRIEVCLFVVFFLSFFTCGFTQHKVYLLSASLIMFLNKKMCFCMMSGV